jgi:mannose-6-phosphate isomerase-like protein (cupin superfamily)
MGDTRFIVIQQKGYNGMEAIGKVETEGRLKYIDGCYDTILSSPIKKGLPCLNALYMPPMINQTAHIHPSARVGIIISGRGKCITPERELDLYGGQVFVIPKNGVHSFNTMQRGNKLAIIAYHPDSDFGATDHDHPMINLTIVDGKSAKNLEAIRTK